MRLRMTNFPEAATDINTSKDYSCSKLISTNVIFVLTWQLLGKKFKSSFMQQMINLMF